MSLELFHWKVISYQKSQVLFTEVCSEQFLLGRLFAPYHLPFIQLALTTDLNRNYYSILAPAKGTRVDQQFHSFQTTTRRRKNIEEATSRAKNTIKLRNPSLPTILQASIHF